MDTPPAAPNQAQPSPELKQDVLALLRVMGQSLNMVLLYGLNHKVATASLEVSFAVATRFMESHGPIHFSIEGPLLLVNGVTTEESPMAANFTTRLTGLNLLSFIIQPGFPLDEYRKFFTVLLTPPSKLGDRDGAALVQSLGFNHVQTKTFLYKRVSGDEPVAEPPATQAPAPDKPAPPAGPDIDGIVSFLSDSPGGNAERAMGDIRALANEPEKLAAVILKTAEQRAGTALPEDRDAVSRLLIGAIQKIVEQILNDPALRTQKGRKHIKRSLLLLEKALAGRLPELAGENAARTITARLTELAEDLDLDELAIQYVKGRRTAGKAGEKLGRLIERISDDPAQLEDLHQHLIREGLTPEGWQELTGKHAGTGGTVAPDVQDLITETARQLSLLSRITDRHINRLEEKLGTEERPRQPSRKDVLEILAELTQEISQPLTIVNGTVALIRSLRAGPLTAPQLELLGMVAESGDRMAQLVDSLMRMAGTPTALTPDQAILGAAYQRP